MAVQGTTTYASLNTPVVLLDLEKLEVNIEEMSHLTADAQFSTSAA